MHGGGEFLAWFSLPGDGAAQPSRGPKRQHIFREQEILGTKAAAHIGADKMKGIFRQAKHGRELPTNAMHAHARENQLKPPIIRTRQRCTRFNRHGMNAVIEQIKADNMIGLRESCIGGSAIAFQETKCLIVRRLRPDLRCFRAKRRRAINHGGQGIVAHLNRLRRVTSGRFEVADAAPLADILKWDREELEKRVIPFLKLKSFE